MIILSVYLGNYLLMIMGLINDILLEIPLGNLQFVCHKH